MIQRCSIAGAVVLLTAIWWPYLAKMHYTPEPNSQTVPSADLLEPLYPIPVVRVEVLNGCGVPQVAARLTRKARALGLDVIEEGNAESFAFLESMVIVRQGDREQACRTAVLLGIPHCIQQTSDDPSRLAELTIIVGRDYRHLKILDP